MICFRGSILHGRRRSVLDSMIMVVFSFRTICVFSVEIETYFKVLD